MARAWAYVDTSVVVKRYVKEAGSTLAEKLLRRHRLIASAVLPVEVMSALSRRQAYGDIAERDFVAIRNRVIGDRAYWELIEVGPEVLILAEELVQQTVLRTLDALHLASLLRFQSVAALRIPLLTADERQREVAAALELDVVWVR